MPGEDDNSTMENQLPESDVVPVYANNVRFEMSAWDLRMFFGQLAPGAKSIDWHTDVSVPWAQAKLMHLYLSVNLAIYELENGRIKVPPGVLPPPMMTPPSSVDTGSPLAMETFQLVQRLINQFRERESELG